MNHQSLPVLRTGSPDGQRFVLLHGFTQTKNSWSQFINHLDSGFEILCFDAPGHGEAAEIAINCAETAKAMVSMAGRAIYLGYSMGARIMLHAAALFPEQVSHLILISGSPGFHTEDERRKRREADESLAQRVLEMGVPVFIDEWLSNPLFAHLNAETNQLEDRLANTAAGLARSLRTCGTGSQESLWDLLPQLEMPILLIAGENDSKFVDIALEMQKVIGTNAQLRIINNAGHSAHLEQPAVVASVVQDWLAEIQG